MIHTFIDDITFNNTITTVTSSSVGTEKYNSSILLIDLAVANDPTDIVIEVEFSDDNVTFYKYMLGPFGDLRYEDSAAKKESLLLDCAPMYVRIKVTATGTDETKTFTLTVKGIFFRR